MWPQCMRERPLEGPRRTSGKGTQLLGSGTAGEGTGDRTEPRVHPRLPSRPSRAPAHRRPLQDARPGCAATRPRPAGPPDTTSPAAPRGRGSGEDRRPARPGSLRALRPPVWTVRMPLGGGARASPSWPEEPQHRPSTDGGEGLLQLPGAAQPQAGPAPPHSNGPCFTAGTCGRGGSSAGSRGHTPRGREVEAGEGGFRVNRDETDTKRRPPGTETAGGGLSTHSGSSLPLSSRSPPQNPASH